MANEKKHRVRKISHNPATVGLEGPSAPAADSAEEGWNFDDFLPPGADITRVSTIGKPREFQRLFAQELVWRGEESHDFLIAVSFAVRAVRIDPASLDARLVLANFAGGPVDEYIEELRRIVAVGEQDFGARYFEKNRGNFWQLMETRPYMRVRTKLALELQSAGRTAEAIAEFEALLALNPNDNQGLRDPLLGCYLEEERLEEANRLFQQYGLESSAVFTWGLVLERYLSGDLGGAVIALATARIANPHVEQFITGKKKLPRTRPDSCRLGDISEAWFCMDDIGGAWNRHREAVLWLKKEQGSGHLFVSERRSKRARSKPN